MKQKYLFFLIFSVLILPLIFTPQLFFPWSFGKTLIFQLLVEVAVVVVVVFWLKEKKADLKISFNWLDLSLFGCLVFLTLSVVFGVNPFLSFFGNQARAQGVIVWWHFFVFYFFAKHFFQNYWHNKKICQTFLLVAVSVSSLIVFTELWPQILPASWVNISGGGIIGNRAFFSAYLLLSLAFSGLLVYWGEGWKKYFGFFSLLLGVSGVIETGIRGSFLGLIVGFVVFGFIVLFGLSKNKKTIFTAVGVATAIIFLFLIFFLFYKDNKIFNFSATSSTATTRLMAWGSALQGFKERPVLGWGWNNFSVVFDKYYNPNFLKFSFVETYWDKPHNLFLEILTSSGILGLVAYASSIFFAFYFIVKAKLENYWVKAILSGALAAILVSNFFLFETTDTLILWFLILALVSGTMQIKSKEIILSNKASFVFYGGIVLAALTFVFNASLVYYSFFMRQAELANNLNDWIKYADQALDNPWESYRNENAVFLSQQFVKFDKDNLISDYKIVVSIAEKMGAVLSMASNKYPQDVQFHIWPAQVYMILGEKINTKYFDSAGKLLDEAITEAPHKQEILFLAGRLNLLQKKFDTAISFNKKAVDEAPQISTSHWFLGLAYIAKGDRVAGLQEVEKALALEYNPTRNEYLYILDIYALEKNYQKLITEYKKLAAAEPEHVDWFVRLATAYALNGNKKEALDLAEQLIQMYPPIKNDAEKFIKQYNLK